MTIVGRFLVVCAMLLASEAALAQENFLTSLGGSWKGEGTVTTRIGARPTRISCSFTSKSTDVSLNMIGTCRGLVVISRKVSADLQVSGGTYAGTYIGPSGRQSSLSGSRSGNALDLAVRWSRVVNGDRDARMTIQKVGARGLTLRTIDRDPATGSNVTTSEINLTR